MKRRLSTLGFVLVLSAVIVSGCVPATVQPAPVPPTPMPVLVTPTPIPPTPVVIVVTATPEPTPVVIVVTATPPEIPPTPTAPAAIQWEVRSLLVGPGSPARLYALLETVTSEPIEYRLLVSDDLGDNWYAFPGGLPDQPAYIHSIDMDYQKLDALYASTSNGLYRWTESQWTPLSPEATSGIGSVAVAYGQPDTLWGADTLKPGRLMRSDDGGITWRVLVTPTNAYDLGLDPRDNAVLYGMVQPSAPFANLYRYANDVRESLPPPQNQNFGSGLTVDGRTGDLYVTTGVTPWTTEPAALWRSTNARTPNVDEVHWEKIHEFEQGVNVKLLASGHTASGLMLFANFDSTADPQAPAQTYRSLDGGQSWVKLTIPVPTSAPTPAPPTSELFPDATYALKEERLIGGYAIRVWRNTASESLLGSDNIVTISAVGQPLVKIESAPGLGDLTGTDITGEGHPDVVVETYSGGAYCCFATFVYDLGPTLTKVLESPESRCPGEFQDLDGDGIFEFITCDVLDFADCPSVAAPHVKVILQYEAGRGYVPASPRFAHLYADDIAAHTQEAEEGQTGEEEARCSVIPLVLDYLYTGQPDQAWGELYRLYAYPDVETLRAKIEEAVSRSLLFVAP